MEADWKHWKPKLEESNGNTAAYQQKNLCGKNNIKKIYIKKALNYSIKF